MMREINPDNLRSFVDRIERLEEEKKNIGDDIRDIYSQAKGAGYEIKALRQIISLRKKDKNAIEEEQFWLDAYKSALGMD